MAAMSNYLENKLVDHLFRGVALAYTAPPTLYVALYTAVTGTPDAGGGTEITGNAYQRAIVNSAPSAWKNTQADGTANASTGTTGVTSNNNIISFPSPTGSWGTVTHFGILDAASGGQLLFHGALTVPQIVNTSNTVSFAVGALQITFA